MKSNMALQNGVSKIALISSKIALVYGTVVFNSINCKRLTKMNCFRLQCNCVLIKKTILKIWNASFHQSLLTSFDLNIEPITAVADPRDRINRKCAPLPSDMPIVELFIGFKTSPSLSKSVQLFKSYTLSKFIALTPPPRNAYFCLLKL